MSTGARARESVTEVVHRAIADASSRPAPLVLAVSGGLDSMVMLEAFATVAREMIGAVATFDHGTGPHARRAAALVERRGRALAVPVVVGRATECLHGEAAWREARWRFLRRAAADADGTIVTAHTDDDHLETVAMRILRGAGARGLAGLLAPADIERPFLALSRATLERYARAHGVRSVVDPSNASRAFLRNRVRLDLLPALRRAHPGIDDELRAVARRSADWRAELERALGEVDARITAAGTLRVAAASLAGYDRESLRVVWPALAARVGARLDRRGTHRLAEFTMSCRQGAIPLSGGWEVARYREALVVRRGAATEAWECPLEGVTDVGRFRFHPVQVVSHARSPDPWLAALPADVPLVVRAWRAGDRMRVAGAAAPRRVKRFLSDARIAGPERIDWPVVVAGDQVLWIPGVRRSDAATARSGRPTVHYHCDRLDR